MTSYYPIEECNSRLSAGVGDLFSTKGHMNIYDIIQGPYKIINLKIMKKALRFIEFQDPPAVTLAGPD